jgi:hypothetical protein
VYVFKALADCWRECPNEAQGAGLEDHRMNAFDIVFLRRIGIRYPDDVTMQLPDQRVTPVD